MLQNSFRTELNDKRSVYPTWTSPSVVILLDTSTTTMMSSQMFVGVHAHTLGQWVLLQLGGAGGAVVVPGAEVPPAVVAAPVIAVLAPVGAAVGAAVDAVFCAPVDPAIP